MLPDGTATAVSVRFAGLDGYLLSKCVAVRTRAATKDYYDLVYVLLNNRSGGPEAAALSLRSGALASELAALRSTFQEVAARYMRTSDSGPRGYAEQAREVDPQADAPTLCADAVDAVQRFVATLDL